MIARLMTTMSLMGALALMPAGQAEADSGDFLVGVIAGGIAGHAIANSNKPRTTTRAAAPRPRIPATERGAQTQTALNYFGYNAGTVDGQIGPGTRAAIERYQVSMGYPVNGRSFPDYQFNALMEAYYWAQNGGQQQVGLYGQQLLMAYKNQQTQTQLATAPVAAPAPQAVPTLQPQAVAPVTTVVAPAPAAPAPTETIIVAAPTEAPSALPNFLGTGEAVSLAGHCNTISLQTNTNGGFTKANAVADPDFALSEQFCVARGYAMDKSQELSSAVTGVSASQIEASCNAYGTLLAAQIGALGVKDRDAVLADVASFIVGSGQPEAALAGNAKICLGVGYRTDNMDVAIGSGLILAAVGEDAYGELMGHHLSQGFGVAKDAGRAKAWYEMGIAASQPVFMPGDPSRVDVIQAAMNGGSAPAANSLIVVPVADEPSTTTLPTFTVNQ